MNDDNQMVRRISETSALLMRKLAGGVRALAGQMHRAGRESADHIQGATDSAAQADAMMRHPRLRRLVDKRGGKAAARRQPSRRNGANGRKGKALSLGATLAFDILLVLILLFSLLRWRGFI